MFNVAFVQSELVTQILQLGENQRSVAGMEAAAKELDEAVQYVFFPSIFELPSRISHDLGYVYALPHPGFLVAEPCRNALRHSQGRGKCVDVAKVVGNA